MNIARFTNIFAGYDPEYSTLNLSNHLPMAVTALWRIGASDEQIADWAENYSKKLRPVIARPNVKIDAIHWREYLGQNHYFEPYCRFFASEYRRLGTAALLRTYLPELAPGLSAAAYHALLRTAYGVIAENDQEIIAGLAYWADSYLPLGPLPTQWSPHVDDPATALTNIAEQLQTKQLKFQQNDDAFLIFERMVTISRQADFQQAVAALDLSSPIDLNAFSVAAIQLYAATDNDITALHGVTGCHALRILSPYFDDLHQVIQYFWQSLCAAYLTLEAPTLTSRLPKTTPAAGWSEIFNAARKFQDEHCIKLVFSCYEEHQATGHPLFQRTAAWKASSILSPATDAEPVTC